MKDPKDLINWVELSRFLANNETSVSQNRIPKKYQDKVNSLIQIIDQWKKEKQECYKSGEPCKYDCSGLCKESC